MGSAKITEEDTTRQDEDGTIEAADYAELYERYKGMTNKGSDDMARTESQRQNERDVNDICEEVEANIERARSLAEAENTEALEALSAETETLISQLPTRGKIGGKTATKAKKDYRDAFKAAATVQEKPQSKAVEGVATKETQDFNTIEGVPELVSLGAEKFADGVRLHVRTHEIANEISKVLLDMRLRMTNKDGLPDLSATSKGAKDAAKALYSEASRLYKANGAADEAETERALNSLVRSVQNQMRNVTLPAYLRELPANAEEAKRYAEIAPAEGENLGEAIARRYKLPGVLSKLQAIEAGDVETEEDQEELTDEQKILSLFKKAEDQVAKAAKRAGKLEEEAKEAVKAEVDAMILKLTKLSATL
jgi:hypothetical protein